MGGRDLRKFQTRTNTVLLDSGVTAEGVHVQPIQFADDAVFLTSRQATSSSTFFTRADREQMKGTWRTVIGSRIVALAPSAGGQSVLAVLITGRRIEPRWTTYGPVDLSQNPSAVFDYRKTEVVRGRNRFEGWSHGRLVRGRRAVNVDVHQHRTAGAKMDTA